MDLRARWWVSASLILALSVGALAAPDGTPPSQLRVLATELRKYAAKWESGDLAEEQEAEITAMLEVVRYDTSSIATLREQMNKARTPTDLFVTNRLLIPLLRAPATVIRAGLGDVQKAHRRLGRYQTPGRIPDPKLPEFRGTVSADVMMNSIAGSQRGTERKIAAENAMVRTNIEVRLLGRNLAGLMVLAEDKEQDLALIRELRRLEQSGAQAYADIIEVIQDAAPRMGQERARVFYDALVELGTELRLKRARYQCPSVMIIRVMGSSTVVESDDRPGIRLLTTANALATFAGRPTVEVPDRREVDEAAQRRSGRSRTR
jgi:hypothetical protein